MANLKEIISLEHQRTTPESWRTIFLHKEGKFYRAYQVSAWLYSCAINEYKVTHRYYKGIEESILFVGFPVESIIKFVTDSMKIDYSDEHCYKIILPEETLISLCLTDEPQKVYERWRDAHPVTDDASTTKGGGQKHDIKTTEGKRGNTSMFGLMQQILAFPIESKSPIECMLFLSDMRKALAEHF